AGERSRSDARAVLRAGGRADAGRADRVRVPVQSRRGRAPRLGALPAGAGRGHRRGRGPVFQGRRRSGQSVNEEPVVVSGASPLVAPSAAARDEDSLYAEFQGGGRPGQATRAWLDAVRDELARRHFSGAGGMEIVREYTGCVDRMVRALYRYAE